MSAAEPSGNSPSEARRIGRYELYAEFARGGMARVHLGRLVGPVGFARTVAIKCLHPGYANDPAAVRMFIDEANLASRVRHPNVVPIVDVLATDGELFLVMEYVRGASLSALIAKGNARGQSPPPLPIVLSVMTGVFAGLHAAHEAVGDNGETLSIVHRDVSPQNVLVGDDGVARLLDFGVAKAERRLHQTSVGEVKGKLAYMSPEQLQGADSVDRRSDVFAGSVVLWELLTGKRLFGRDSAGATVSALMERTVSLPSADNPSVPPELDALVLRGLSQDAGARPETALEVVRALEGCGRAASVREVAEWVTSLAQTELESAAAIVANIEHLSIVTAKVAPETESPAARGSARPPSEEETLPAIPAMAERDANPFAPRFGRRLLGAAVLGFLVMVAVGIGVVTRPRSGTNVASPVSSPSPAEAAALAVPMPPRTDEQVAPDHVTTESVDTDAGGPALAAATVTSSSTKLSHAAVRGGSRKHANPSRRVIPKDCRVLRPDGTFGYRRECLE